MLIAVVLKNEQTSILTTTFVVLGFFLFSDAVTPLETMPGLAAFFASRNPFVLASIAFKKIIIFGVGMPGIFQEFTYLASYLLAAFFILIIVSLFKLKKTR
jgi:hypothetical protein